MKAANEALIAIRASLVMNFEDTCCFLKLKMSSKLKSKMPIFHGCLVEVAEVRDLREGAKLIIFSNKKKGVFKIKSFEDS